MSARPATLAMSPRAKLTLAFAAVASLVAFVWPLFAGTDAVVAGSDTAPLLFALVLPLVAAVAAAEISTGGFDAKTVAMLGVLSALGAGLRPLGAGAGGIELVFFLIVLGGRVFGPGFGFILGSTTLAVSALITAGVGPWLPYQMLAASWVGLGAALLPKREGRAELALLAVYGAMSSVLFGMLMNLSFWPFTLGPDTSLSFVAGDPVWANLRRFLAFEVVTSLAWEIGRAITTAGLILVVGGTILRTLRRASARAAFDSKPVFERPSRQLSDT
ncbi:MAG TPA: ECF transporter S component [Acidimicrobiia bacterium]|jgi:energy-coupling factor transport system substrate-specific component